MKILVEVKTPGNGKTYEFQLDRAMSVGQAKTMMIEEITEIESGNITLIPEKVILNNLNTEMKLEDTDSVSTTIKSGHNLILL